MYVNLLKIRLFLEGLIPLHVQECTREQQISDADQLRMFPPLRIAAPVIALTLDSYRLRRRAGSPEGRPGQPPRHPSGRRQGASYRVPWFQSLRCPALELIVLCCLFDFNVVLAAPSDVSSSRGRW